MQKTYSNPLGAFYSNLSSGKPQFIPACRAFFWVEFLFPDGMPNGVSFELNDIPFLVQSINLPDLQLEGSYDRGENTIEIKNIIGGYKLPGNVVVLAKENEFTVNFIDCEYSVIENLFVPWMVEVTNSNASGKTFTRANIDIYCLNSNNPQISDSSWTMRYTIKGAYPKYVDTPNLSMKEAGNVERSVNFDFNNIDFKLNENYISEYTKDLFNKEIKRIDDMQNLSYHLSKNEKLENILNKKPNVTKPYGPIK